MTTKSTYSALGAPMSLAWVYESPRAEELTLSKSVESGNLGLNKAVIRCMSVNYSSEWRPRTILKYNSGVLLANTSWLTIDGFSLSERHPTGLQRYVREIVLELDSCLQNCRLGASFMAKLVVPAGSEPGLTLRAIDIEQYAFAARYPAAVDY